LSFQSYAEFERRLDRYPSSSFEKRDGVEWIRLQGRRHYQMFEMFMRCRRRLPAGPLRVIDVGAFPGTLLKGLRLLCGETGPLVGVGLEAPDAFMASLREHEIDFVRANLDPIIRTPDPDVEALPRRIPFEDESFDLAFCTEAIEHVLDPMFALREIRRVLAPGGLFVMTTPNQAKISNRLKLALLGESINYPLKSSIMYELSNWRPHMREYTMAEMSTIVEDAGFRILERKYLDVSDDDVRMHTGASLKLRAIKLALRLFTRIPSCRHTLMFLLEKTRDTP
jgi:SAM-dependent methyltransferase